MPSLTDVAPLAGVGLAMAASLATLAMAAGGWRSRRNPLDLSYACAIASVLAYLMASKLAPQEGSDTLTVFISRLALQVAIGSISFFLLLGAAVLKFEIHAVWMLQILVGTVLLAWGSVGPHAAIALGLWTWLNLLVAAGLVVVMGQEALQVRTLRLWAVFGLGVMGMGVFAQLQLPLGGIAIPPVLKMAPAVFVGLLPALWLALTERGIFGHSRDQDNPATTIWMSITTGVFAQHARSAEAAVASERRRIALDLHDGVGSQLVNILASLKPTTPAQEKMAAALEQCLMDLKITVDNIDGSNDSVLDALGRLRYRIQPLLDRQGIDMAWHVDIDGALESVRGERAKHVVRIAQECLSNCMRHANATVIRLSCTHVVVGDCLLFEFSDNGDGMAIPSRGHSKGKGLEYMHWRAGKLGGRLYMTTRPGGGVRMRLQVPMRAGLAAD